MAKKKTTNRNVPQPAPAAVVHGDCFRTFIDEARSIGNECTARREFDADVVEYLKQKGIFDDWSAWREAKHAQKT